MSDKPFGNATPENLDRMADIVQQATASLAKVFALWQERDIPGDAWPGSYPFGCDLQEQVGQISGWAEAIRNDAEMLRKPAPPPIYVVYARDANALALDESGRYLLNAAVVDGVVADEWSEVNHNLLPEETNEALRRIFGALLTMPAQVPPP